MSVTTFDSLDVIRDLEEAGVERAQAEIIARAVRSASMADRKELATKSDISAMEVKFAALETKFSEFKADISATINKVILAQIAVAAALFAALKLF